MTLVAKGIACVSIGLASATASAGFTANYVGYGLFESHMVGYSTALSWNSNASVTMFSLKLAEHKWTLNGETAYTWCAQLYQGVTAGNDYVFDTVALELAPQTPPAPGPMGIGRATVLRDAMSRFLQSDGRVASGLGSASATTAAFCALAWEITHENFATQDVELVRSRIDLGAGAFRVALSGESAAIFAAMVSNIGNGGYRDAAAEGWTSPTAQDQFRLVPSPGSLAILGLAGVAAIRRRR